MFKAIVMSAEEITGQEGCKEFNGESKGKVYSFTHYMNEMSGKEITLKEYSGVNGYDYVDDEGDCWQKNWLKNIREEVDWSKVPVDTKVVGTFRYGSTGNYYFAKFEDGKVWLWSNGKTSWSAFGSLSAWPPEQVSLWKEDKKCFRF